MSTDYEVLKVAAHKVELLEHSGKLDLMVDNYDGQGGININDLTPHQVAAMALKMLHAAWYQDEDAVYNACTEAKKQFVMCISI